MNLALFAGATVAWAGAAVAYFHARFRLAGVLGVCFWGLAATVAARAMAPWVAALAFGLLGALPAGFLLVHVIDAKKGIFLLPTIYAIPFAFVCGLLLWAATGLGLLL